MNETKRKTLQRIFCLVVLVAVVVFGTICFEAYHTRKKIQDTLTELCTEAMVNIQLNLTQGDEISPEYLYRFHEITQVFPDTYYMVLADALLPLIDAEISSQLPQEQRDALAALILRSMDTTMAKEEWEPLIYDVENILAPYMYP